MLILPLHRPLTLKTFPAMTAWLLLANVVVFFLFQVGDGAAIHAAREHYQSSGLAAIEAPAYERWLERNGRHQALIGLRTATEDARRDLLADEALTDVAFARDLAKGDLFADQAQFERWRELRPPFDAARDEVFTLRHILRSNEIDPWRMLASAFLHGGFGHLFGNMIFLVALGLLVEGALGQLRFLALYLLGAMGSAAVSLAWRWGESGGGLGASGAIAALMGAFCVVWGRQPVRFFYWIGVVFDYVRGPAIWLLPAWLGWEIYNLFANPDLGVGFDAHIGGLLSGAALGGVLVATRQVRDEFIRDDDVATTDDARWAQSQAHLGRMELAEADALLAQLQAEKPQRFDVALARYRVARNGGQRAPREQRATDLLRLSAGDPAQAQLQAEVARQEPDLVLDASALHALARRWLELDADDEVERLLLAAPVDAADAELPKAWFALGLQRNRQGSAAGFERALQTLAARYPQHELARKARFLLENRDG